ncbi:conserved hypothetical protein [Culex quinquefasciatus]|uniref:Chromo shadow domain-containing protein n=1 Tax=Culex quinquefasciatus TaxID=7176 RepID=B0WW95_CULQU|nr:conserved hypothetical protein [Culex quinquefasciatus]|eukprot:XP_001861667.1 conserved hypothetical protein [Culex quinquefasciatus]
MLEIPALVHALITRLLEVSWSSEDESAESEVCADDIKHVWWVVLVADGIRLMLSFRLFQGRMLRLYHYSILAASIWESLILSPKTGRDPRSSEGCWKGKAAKKTWERDNLGTRCLKQIESKGPSRKRSFKQEKISRNKDNRSMQFEGTEEFIGTWSNIDIEKIDSQRADSSPVSGCATHRATLPGEITQFPPAPTTAESFSFCHGIFAFFATLLSYSLLYLGSYSFFFSKRIAGQKQIRKGHMGKKLDGVTEEDGDQPFLIRWKGVDKVDLVLFRIVHQDIPALVVDFYESRIINAAKISVL